MKPNPSLPLSLRATIVKTLLVGSLLAASSAHAAAPPKAYRVTSSPNNTNGSVTTIDHPAFNGKPTLRLIVGQYSTGVSNPHPVGVLYHHLFKKWQILNEDGVNIAANCNFNVMLAPTAKPVSVSPANVDGGLAFFPAQKGNANANLLSTHLWNPIPALNGVNVENVVGLFYIPPGSRAPVNSGRWALYNENAEPHIATVHNVIDVTNLKVANTLISFRHTAAVANTTDGETVITHALTDGKPNAVLFVQHVFTPAAPKSVDETLGVRYADGKWRIFTQDGDDLPVSSEFVVAAFPAVTP